MGRCGDGVRAAAVPGHPGKPGTPMPSSLSLHPPGPEDVRTPWEPQEPLVRPYPAPHCCTYRLPRMSKHPRKPGTPCTPTHSSLSLHPPLPRCLGTPGSPRTPIPAPHHRIHHLPRSLHPPGTPCTQTPAPHHRHPLTTSLPRHPRAAGATAVPPRCHRVPAPVEQLGVGQELLDGTGVEQAEAEHGGGHAPAEDADDAGGEGHGELPRHLHQAAAGDRPRGVSGCPRQDAATGEEGESPEPPPPQDPRTCRHRAL